jgi:hypothetical protein
MVDLSEIEAARDGRRPFPDLSWLCVDAAGDVGIFISAGFGPVPLEIFASVDDYARAWPIIEGMIESGSFYVYDYVGVGWYEPRKAYDRIRVPFATVRDNASMQVFPHVRICGVRFADAESVVIEDFFDRLNV